MANNEHILYFKTDFRKQVEAKQKGTSFIKIEFLIFSSCL